MIHRASQLFLPTLRDDPADAEAISHKLLVRGGFIRQVSAGVWTFMPLGWRVHRKVEQIIREEMDAIGGQEMLMPVLTPAELWEKTGRLDIPEVFHVEDSPYILPVTHEETVTFHAREIQSYKQLPQLWYHFQTKDRDEPRPRGGLLRVREFIMKDAYSFDRDEESVKVSFEANRGAYKKIFERCGIEAYDVVAESGIMGGKFSVDFLAPSGSGENVLVRCQNGDYAADGDIAEAVPRVPTFPETLVAPEEISTPGVTTCEALADFLGVDIAATSKAMPVTKPDGSVVLALVRGDDRLSEMKLYDAMPGESRPSTDEEIRAAFGASGGSLGPVGFAGEVIADETLRDGQFVAGANKDGYHLRGVEAGRDYEPRFADLREPKEGDRCPVDGGTLEFLVAVEVGHIFNFGSFYSKPLEATFLDEDGQEKPLLGGSYGIGPGRVMAAIVEQHFDENGIQWPRSVAPYDVHLVVLPGADEIALEAAEALSANGLDVLLDDRDQRAGEKFADADLIGCPIRVTAGKKSLEDGRVDVRDRATGVERRLSVAELGKEV
ncbi:MAG: proline--tRNA ligase [Actinobacteria bacterium]|nr:proline--tRNA ligase [Actinomycetota bacterium]MBV8478963.1 proline--tRNA ligase [Actinomycetota bacterium]